MTIDEVIKILNHNSSRKYSKEQAKELYEFLKIIAEQQVSLKLKKN